MATGVLKVKVGGTWQPIITGTLGSTPTGTESYLTQNAEAALPNSRRLVAGTGIVLNTSVAGQMTIGVSGSGTGDVIGPSSSVDNHVALFSGTTGKIIKDSGGIVVTEGSGNAVTMKSNVVITGPNAGDIAVRLKLWDMSQPADKKKWEMYNYSQFFNILALNDAENAVDANFLFRREGSLVLGSLLTNKSMVRVEGPRDPVPTGATGLGTEIFTQGGNSYFHSYNISTGQYGPCQYYGISHYMNAGLTVAGDFRATGSIGCDTNQWRSNLHNAGGYMYPGQITAGGAIQSSWFLGSHSSYGLYSNTGLYIEGAYWTPAYIQPAQGVRLPTNYGASVDPNILDAYQEGNWSPTSAAQSGQGIGLSVNNAVYTKIGRVVHVSCMIQITSVAGTGIMYLYGLPWAAAVDTGLTALINNVKAGYTGSIDAWPYVPAGANYVAIYAYSDPPAIFGLVEWLKVGTDIRLNGTYIAAG